MLLDSFSFIGTQVLSPFFFVCQVTETVLELLSHVCVFCIYQVPYSMKVASLTVTSPFLVGLQHSGQQGLKQDPPVQQIEVEAGRKPLRSN
jgi:hypothetical protein